MKVLCNQKFIGELEVKDGTTEDEALALIKNNPAINKKLQAIKITKTIYRPGEVLNIIGK